MAESEANGAMLPANLDDFRKIKKITQPVARALYELEIRRYADLAALTPGILADLLRAKNVPFVSAQRIEREDWIGQARLLVEKQAENAALAEQVAPVAGADPSQDAPCLENQPARPARHDWRELADFFVSFGEQISADGKAKRKTKAHFSQGDLPFERDGIATGELIQWMLSQAGLTAAESPELGTDTPASPVKPETPPMVEAHAEIHKQEEEPGLLTVSNLWVSQANQPSPSQRMVRVEADVNVSAEAAIFLTEPISFMISIYLVNTQTNGSIFIETSTITMSQGELPYAFKHDFPVPPPGRYQLYLLAGLPSAGKAPILQQGPIVRVER